MAASRGHFFAVHPYGRRGMNACVEALQKRLNMLLVPVKGIEELVFMLLPGGLVQILVQFFKDRNANSAVNNAMKGQVYRWNKRCISVRTLGGHPWTLACPRDGWLPIGSLLQRSSVACHELRLPSANGSFWESQASTRSARTPDGAQP
ncbi:hypothetical protein THIARS_70684 [Thiomonas delicata]|uniref:Uncharacterized protein n=1 Tax=Thiomonas delicata TaxID=364030 RepID=A0A238D7F5_THIDL|nr:hypothetical protein THIARS_70684 [Thiomonas delicata]